MREDENNAPQEIPGAATGPTLGFAAAVRVAMALDEAETYESDAAAVPGDLRIPPYSIERKVGEGAGGTVYRAFREGSDRAVALKVLARGLGTGPESRRAWRELAILSDLHLRSLPRVIDHGVHEGRLYIATEFVEGSALDEYCAGHPRGIALPGDDELGTPGGSPVPLSLPDRASLLVRVCDAVQELHEHGVIHRDLKPSNILVDGRGHVFVIDLGIAALMDHYSDGPVYTLTEEGRPIGTPAFMSPEQARGERQRTSTRSDVYSLGAVGYVLLTGHTPHDTHTTIHEAVRRVAEDEPREARSLEPGLARGLAAVLEKAVSREPERRYASAAALAADLRRWLAGEAVEAQPPGAWRKAVRWVGRHPIASTATACAAVVTLTIAGTFVSVWWVNERPWKVVVVDSQREARLLSRSGRILHAWRSSAAEGAVHLAELAWLPRESGGHPVVVTVINYDADHPESSGQLCVWDTRDFTRPLWSTPSGPPELTPPRPSEATDQTYEAGGSIVADVFPSLPGVEIVVTHNQIGTPSAIRIYDLAGIVLYEAWHVGGLGNPIWLGDCDVLVLRGSDNTHKWYELGRPDVVDVNPAVLLGVRPMLGQKLGLIYRHGSVPGAAPVWYRYVLPPRFAGGVPRSLLSPPVDATKKRSGVQVDFRFADDGCAVWWLVDGAGRIAARGANDEFYRQHPGLALEGLYLADTPDSPPIEQQAP